jgi:hypothetical protein
MYIVDIIRMEREGIEKAGIYGIEGRNLMNRDAGRKSKILTKMTIGREDEESEAPTFSKTESAGHSHWVLDASGLPRLVRQEIPVLTIRSFTESVEAECRA